MTAENLSIARQFIPLRRSGRLSLEFCAQHQIDEKGLVVAERAVERGRDLGRPLDADRINSLPLRERVEAQLGRSEIETLGLRLVLRLAPVAPILLQITLLSGNSAGGIV